MDNTTNPYENIKAEEPRAWTAEEIADILVRYCVHTAEYWAKVPSGATLEDRCRAVAFSILYLLDGSTLDIPSIDLLSKPYQSDKAFGIGMGENYYEPGTIVNFTLHEKYRPIQRALYGHNDQAEALSKKLTPDQMREQFVGRAHLIAVEAELAPSPKEAAHAAVRDMIKLIDGQYSNEVPPFMIFAAPTREFDAMQLTKGNQTWDSSIPLNRKALTYGIEESLVEAYDQHRQRYIESAKNMFKS